MKYYDWNDGKNALLKIDRNISFEQVVVAIEEGRVLDNVDHPNKKRYPNQRMLIIHIEDYAYLVPFIEDAEKIFFKTIIPSRKATEKYLKKGG